MLVVTISTNVSNVALHIVPRPVIFVPQGHQPLVQNHFHHELPTPEIIKRLLSLSHEYDAHVTLMLSNSFSQGFLLYFNGVPLSFCSKNLLSALQHPNVVSAKLIQEVKAGRMLAHLIHLLLKIFVFLLWLLFLKRFRANFDLFIICRFPRVRQ